MSWYYVVTSDMAELGLKGYELPVFAIIYGYSQNRQGCYYGSLAYLCEVVGITKPTAIKILKELTERGILEKRDTYENGVHYCSYRVGKNILPGGKEILPGWLNNLTGGGKEILPNNKENNKENNKDIYAQTPQERLLSLGVSEETLQNWLKVRKEKRSPALNSSIINTMEREAQKAGLTLVQAVELCAGRGWAGFRASYLDGQEITTPKKSYTKSTYHD